jgi:hypothetical protein
VGLTVRKTLFFTVVQFSTVENVAISARKIDISTISTEFSTLCPTAEDTFILLFVVALCDTCESCAKIVLLPMQIGAPSLHRR